MNLVAAGMLKKKGSVLNVTSNVVAQVRVQAEELGQQAWEGEGTHLQQILRVLDFVLFRCFIVTVKSNTTAKTKILP